MGTIVRRKDHKSVIYRAEVRREGQRLTKTCRTKTEAKDWIHDIESKISNGQRIPKFKRFTVAEAIDRYISERLPYKKEGTRKFQKPQLEWIRARIGHLKLSKLTEDELSALRDELHNQEILRTEKGTGELKPTGKRRTASTLNRYFQPLMHCLRIASYEWKWLSEVPRFKNLKENPARTEYYSPEQIKAVLGKIEEQAIAHIKEEKRKDRQFSERMNLVIARIALLTGARLTETCKLRWANVDLIGGVIRFPGEDTKTGKGREVPIAEGLKIDLVRWRQERTAWAARFPSDYLFPALRPSKKGYRSDFASKVFRKAAKSLGIVNKTFHDIRHTAASWATKLKTPTRTVQRLLGHSRIATTERYSHVDISSEREAVQGIEEMLQQGAVGEKDKVH